VSSDNQEVGLEAAIL